MQLLKKEKKILSMRQLVHYIDEEGNLVALDTVFNTYNSLDNRTKAK